MNCARDAVVLLILTVTAALSAAAVPDQPRPVDPQEAKYRALLYQKLCLTPFDCGRIIVMPPFQKSEISVSIYSRRCSAGAIEYYATSVEAADNLRDSSDAGRFPDRAKRVKVRRIDAPIPEKTAQLLKQVWLRMLNHVQRPADLDMLGFVYTDPTELEFCIGTQTRVSCRETPWAPSLPKKMLLFTDLAETLPNYCAAHAAARSALAQELDRRAGALLRMLKGSGTVSSSNQTLERTAGRRENFHMTTLTFYFDASRASVSGRSACSR